MHIAGLVAPDQKRIEIEVREHLALALQLDVAHGTGRGGTAAQKDRIHQRAERAHRVLARLPRLPGHIHLDGVNLPQIDAQLEVAVNPLQRGAQVAGDRGKRQAGNMHGARLGKVDLSLAAHAQIGAEVDLSPDADAQFVPCADHHVLRRRGLVERAEGCRLRGEEAGSIDWQHAACGGSHKALKLGGRLGGQRSARSVGRLVFIPLRRRLLPCNSSRRKGCRWPRPPWSGPPAAFPAAAVSCMVSTVGDAGDWVVEGEGAACCN